MSATAASSSLSDRLGPSVIRLRAALSSDDWQWLVPLLAYLKLGAGLIAFFSTYGMEADRVFPYPLHLIFALPFMATATLLLLGSRRDPRAFHLGGFFLMAATAFLNRPMRIFAEGPFHGAGLMGFLDILEMDAFMAWYLWCFARDFPHPLVSPKGQQRIRAGVAMSLAAGIVFFALNLANYAWKQLTGAELLDGIGPMRGRGPYYSVILSLTTAAFAFLYWRGRHLQGQEQRRLRLFLQGLALAAAPLMAEILLGLFVRPYWEFKEARPELSRTIILTMSSFLLLLPFSTHYAVLVHQVLDVRLLARRAMQYALARYSAMALTFAPLAALAVYVYLHRAEEVQAIVSGYRIPLLLSIAFVGVAALQYRQHVLNAIDRRFFRERYDAQRILASLVENIRAVPDCAGLSTLITREIDLALHLEGVALLVLDPRSGTLSDPRHRSRKLDATSPLALLVADASEPLAIDLDNPRSPLLKVPERDRHWLVDSGFKLIVPILARDGSLLGILGLGEKLSGLPFLKEDNKLLRAIANSAAWVLELAQSRREHSQPSTPRPTRIHSPILEDDDTVAEPIALATATDLAKECAKCGMLYPSYTVLCSACSKRLETSRVPYILPGKFRFEKRIGIGGMGVVYKGSDLSLGRAIAVKTLRRVSPEDAMRLRREARTAAAVSHHYLAPVYGMETWQGTPILVLELLEGGTLANRLQDKGRLSPLDTVELGIAMCEALGQLHAADILHRDIKPSNIGYTRDGTPKLMDFGIARLMYDLRREREEGEAERLNEDPSLIPSSSLWTHIDGITPLSKPLVGTLSYLSPEALEGRPPDAQFDLWSLAIVLYECLLGRKVFSSADPRQTAARIRMGRVPDMLQLRPEYDETLGDFFRGALHRNRNRRPSNAFELKQRLELVRAQLGR